MYLLQDQYYCDPEQSINHAKYIRSLESQQRTPERTTKYIRNALQEDTLGTFSDA
jgi:hypothetical protein